MNKSERLYYLERRVKKLELALEGVAKVFNTLWWDLQPPMGLSKRVILQNCAARVEAACNDWDSDE